MVDLVIEIRRKMPRLGVKKLYHILKSDLEKSGKIGRDRLFDILRKHGLLVERKKSYTRTTNSFHRFYRHSNLLKNSNITVPDQCFVSDITCIRTERDFVYLFLLTDYFSRKIVGWNLSIDLSLKGGLSALQMALRQRINKDTDLIHHSDRGIQYCSNQYVDMLKEHDVRISMTEASHCYENALAERVNGILKDEFLLDGTFKDFEQAQRAVKEAITVYNDLRPHWSLNLQVPSEVHRRAA